MALHEKVLREPGQQEIPRVIAAEQAEEGAPRRAPAQDRAERWYARRPGDGSAGVNGARGEAPWREPKQAHNPDAEEHNPPAVARQNETTDEDPDRRAGSGSRVDQCIDEPTPVLVE